jgi:hypothetical protein
MSANPPPIREPWKTDKTGKLVSMPWVLWLQQLASVGQVDDIFSGALTLVSTAESSSHGAGTPATPDDVASLAAMVYNPSSSTAPSNDPEMLIWMSF